MTLNLKGLFRDTFPPDRKRILSVFKAQETCLLAANAVLFL